MSRLLVRQGTSVTHQEVSLDCGRRKRSQRDSLCTELTALHLDIGRRLRRCGCGQKVTRSDACGAELAAASA